MGKIFDVLMGELKTYPEGIIPGEYEHIARKVETKLSSKMPYVDTGRDPWLKVLKEGGHVSVNIQGKKNKKYNLSGAELDFFIRLYSAYGYKEGKREAAAAFVATVIIEDFKNLTSNEKNEYAIKVIKAALKENNKRDPNLKTPKMLQGWITSRRFED